MRYLDPALPHITFILHDVEGGIASMNHQIVESAPFLSHFNVHIILWRTKEDKSKPFKDNFNSAIDVIIFNYSQYDNYYHILKSFNILLNKLPGYLVVNDGFELQAIERFGTSSIIFAIVHDFYNLKIAVNSLHLIDYFLCHTTTFTNTLLSLSALSGRVFYLPHGVKVQKLQHNSKNDKLKIVSISRLVEDKGVMNFLEIDDELVRGNIYVEWIIIGSGNLEATLKAQWKGKNNITFYQPDTNLEVLQLANKCDIFISPSIFEGYGIALLEAMSCGLVPIIHKLPVGIYSSLPDHVGYSIEVGDLKGFVNSIKDLANNRTILENKSREAHKYVIDNYNITLTAKDYLNTLLVNNLPKVAKNNPYKKVSTFGILDKRFIPNKLTRSLKQIKKLHFN